MNADAAWPLRFLVVLQLIVGAVGLVVVDPDTEGESVSTLDSSTTSTTARADSTKFGAAAKNDDATTTTTTTKASGADVGSTPPTTAASRQATTTTTAAARQGTTTTRPAAQGLTPAKAGVYEYRITYSGGEDSETTTGRYTLSEAKEQDGEVRQNELDTEDDITTTTSYAWRSDGLYVRSVTNDGVTCDFQPDIKVVPSPPAVGRSWPVDTSCTEEGETVGMKGTSRTVRTERITVAGRPLDVLVIETTVHTSEGDFTSRQSFSVERGLIVRDETTYDDGSSEVTELLNIDPK